MASKMPHKVRKLVVAGPKDSGKTSWASIFHRIITPGKIASITGERQFSAQMITDETQLVLMDEWSESTLQSYLAKTILQGGWMVTAVKHGMPRTVMNNSPFYITTNKVPDFRNDDENVKRRIVVFETTSLPQTIPGVDRWMYDNAMDCIAWLAKEITSLREHIDPEELWYEPVNVDGQTINNNEGLKLFDHATMANITNEDMHRANTVNPQQEESRTVIHRSFEIECVRQRVRRKRRNRSLSPLYSSSDEDQLSSCAELEDETPNKEIEQDTLFDRPLTHIQPKKTHKRTLIGSTVTRTNSNSPDKPLSSEVSAVSNQDANLAGGEETLPQQRANSNTDNLNESDAADAEQREHEHARTTRSGEKIVKDGENPDPGNSSESREIEVSSWPPLLSSPWVLNDENYHRRIVQLWEYNFGHEKLSRAHAFSFSSRRENAERRRNKDEREFWTTPDPEIDAWMVVVGKCRDVFDIDAFVKRQENSYPILKRIRRKVEVRVMDDRCPMLLSMRRQQSDGKQQQQDNKEDESRQVVLGSQSYWTTIKNWRPW